MEDFGQMNLDAALESVEEHADAEWKLAALEAVNLVARQTPDFTTDEVWRVLDRTDFRTHDNRAMGAIMRRAVAEGWVKSTPDYRESRRPECHKRPVKVWRSLIWKDHS